MKFRFLKELLAPLLIASILAAAPLMQSCTAKRATVTNQVRNDVSETVQKTKTESENRSVDSSKTSTIISETILVRSVELSKPDSSGKQTPTKITEQIINRVIAQNKTHKNAKTNNSKKEESGKQTDRSSDIEQSKCNESFGFALFESKKIAAIVLLLLVIIIIIKKYVKHG